MDIEVYGVFIVPLILGLVEAAKRVGFRINGARFYLSY